MKEGSEEYWEQCKVDAGTCIYRVQHRIMEGDCQYDHGPRLVNVKKFLIDKYPVTNKKYKNFLEESGYIPKNDKNFLKHWYDGTFPECLENHPVVWVSLYDAREYANWFGGRMPTDIEWQWAAGGKLKRKWPWGDMFDKLNCNSAGKTTTPVDKYSDGICPWGCFDMCGNAGEWIDDIQDDGIHLFTFIRGGSYHKAPH